MSLINDALKRASQSETPPLPPMEVMQPVHYPRSAKWPLVILPLILISVLTVAIWFMMRGWQSAHQKSPAGTTGVSARSATPPVPAPAVQGQPAVAASTPAKAAALVAPAKEPIAVEPPVPATPTFPTLKLQAVFYRHHNPSVVINTRPLRVGDRIDNARVVSITREAVVVEWGGETRSIVLP